MQAKQNSKVARPRWSTRGALQFLTVDEVAGLLAVRRPSVYRLIAHGDLDALRVGRLWRVTKPSLDAFLRQGGNVGRVAR
jgi:excisionase family DNA binding protein